MVNLRSIYVELVGESLLASSVIFQKAAVPRVLYFTVRGSRSVLLLCVIDGAVRRDERAKGLYGPGVRNTCYHQDCSAI